MIINSRKINRNQEKEYLNNLRKTYKKKPKGICPKCHKHSLFMTNKNGEIFCVRCNEKIKNK